MLRTTISIVSIVLATVCVIFISVMTIKKGKLYNYLRKSYIAVLILINIGLFINSYILTLFANVYANNDNLTFLTMIFKSIFESFELYVFSFTDNELIIMCSDYSNLYSVACTIAGVSGILGIVLSFCNSLISDFINLCKINKIKNKEHYIIIGDIDAIKKYNFDFGKNKKTVVVFDISKNKVITEGYGKSFFCQVKDFFGNEDRTKIVNNLERKYYYKFSTDIENSLRKAGITANKVVVISFYEADNNKLIIDICNKYLKEDGTLYIKDNNVVDNNLQHDTKYEIKLFSIEDMKTRNFVFNYPLYKYLPDTILNRNTGYFNKKLSFIFLGSSDNTLSLIKSLELYYQGYNCTFNATVISDDEKLKADVISYHSNNKRIIDECLGNNDYYDVGYIDTTLNDIRNFYKIDGEYKEHIKANLKDFSFIFVENIDDSKRQELFDYLTNEPKEYVIFTNDKCNYHGNNKNIIKVCSDESILINQFLIDDAIEKIGIAIKKNKSPNYNPLNDFYNNRESRRVATLGINIKLSLLGYELGTDQNKNFSNEFKLKYLTNFNNNLLDIDNYDYSCAKINLGLIEKVRWNANEILIKQTMPMKKAEILIRNAGKPTIYSKRKNNIHPCIVSIKGLRDLEIDVKNAYDFDKKNNIEPAIKEDDFRQFAKDCSTMDYLIDGLEETKYYYICKYEPFK